MIKPKNKKYFILGLVLASLIYFFIEAKHIYSEPMTLWSQFNSVGDAAAIDCGIVLTGAPGRIREGFELLQAKKIKRLIVSGVFKEATYSEVFPYWPYYSDINSDDVILEKRSQTTFGNAHQSVVLAESYKCQDVVLLTSQLHMYRAYKIFRDVFPENIVIKKLTLPNAKSEQSKWDFIFELFKLLFYSVFSLVNFFTF